MSRGYVRPGAVHVVIFEQEHAEVHAKAIAILVEQEAEGAERCLEDAV